MEQPFIAQGRNNTLLNEQVNELLVHDGKRYTMVHGLHAKDWPMMDHGGSGWFTTDHADPGWITENHCGSRWNGMIGECKWILSDTDRHKFCIHACSFSSKIKQIFHACTMRDLKNTAFLSSE